MAIVGTDYRLLRVNAALSEALGYTAEELLARSFVELTHPDDIRRDTEQAAQLFRGEVPSYRIEKRFLTKQGKLVWLDVSAFIIRDPSDDQMLYGLAMVQDITERRESEAALRTSEERYRTFVVNSSEAIWRFEITDPIPTELPVDDQIEAIYSGSYLAECNDAMARLYGRDRAEDILGAPLSDFISLDNAANLASLRDFIGNHYRLHNTHAISPNPKGDRHFSSSVIGIALNGFLLRVWGTQRDETARWQAEDQLNQSREQLRALVAHLQNVREHERCDLSRELHDDLGQSLTSLKLDLFRIAKHLEQPVDDQVRQKITGRLESAMELIEKTIGQVKAISTELRPGVLDKFGLTAAIEWQCAEFQRRSRINCQCHLPQHQIQLAPAQSTALFRVLQEALGNVARHSQATNVSVTLEMDESQVMLSVRDNGRGITAAEIAAPDSLGLLGMRERAEMLGGQFLVEGAPGHTLINAWLPISSEG